MALVSRRVTREGESQSTQAVGVQFWADKSLLGLPIGCAKESGKLGAEGHGICIFFFVIPIEELNAFSALIIGVGYNMIVRDKGIYK